MKTYLLIFSLSLSLSLFCYSQEIKENDLLYKDINQIVDVLSGNEGLINSWIIPCGNEHKDLEVKNAAASRIRIPLDTTTFYINLTEGVVQDFAKYSASTSKASQVAIGVFYKKDSTAFTGVTVHFDAGKYLGYSSPYYLYDIEFDLKPKAGFASGTYDIMIATFLYNSYGTLVGGVIRDKIKLTIQGAGSVNAAFTGTPTSGKAELKVNFTDQSTGTVTGWSWDFGDGGTSTLKDPEHTYNTPGIYSVSLTVTGSSNSDTETKTAYIEVTPPEQVAAFTSDVTNGCSPLTVYFTDQSPAPVTSWAWDFGDGNTSNLQNPEHTYTEAGTYTVSLTVTGDYGTDTETKTGYIFARKCEGVTFPISNLIFGTVTNDADFKGTVEIVADDDSVYLQFVISDDVIVNAGNFWQVDNIEIYFDMDNSKNIAWPREHNWITDDPTFDGSDFQLRLIPGINFSINNSTRPDGLSIESGYRQVYKATGSGYEFTLVVDWDALLTGFTPITGTKIGFDVDASDCDVPSAVNDANRNQLTLNSPTIHIYNDPSLWAELEYNADGIFEINYDTEAPSDPPELEALVDETTVTLSWKPSNDNRAVMSYVILDGEAELSNILAKESGNNYSITGLEEGSYIFGVRALDNYGNQSEKVTVEAEIDLPSGMDDKVAPGLPVVYPNPAQNEINILHVPSEAVINIWSLTGQLLISRAITGDCAIDISSLQKGIYNLQWYTADQTSMIRLIKQ